MICCNIGGLMSSFKVYISIILIGCSGTLNGQTAEDILNKYVVALGDKQVLDSIKTFKYTREFEHTDSGRTNRTTTFYKKPNLLRWESGDHERVLITVGKMEWRGKRDTSDGTIAWDEGRSVSREPFVLKPFGNFLNEKRSAEFLYTGNRMIDSVRVHCIHMISPNGWKTELYFDAENGLLLQTKSGTKDSRMGLMVSHFSDYRAVGEVLFPFQEEATREVADGRKFHQINKVIDIQINTPMDDSLFKIIR